MTRTATEVRRATTADLESLVPMLGRAFFDDPVAVWACRSETLRPAMLASIHRARLRRLLTHGQVWTAGASAASWALPGQWQTTILQDASLALGMLRPRLLMSLPRLVLGLRRIQRTHSLTRDHWYLSLLGTDPDMQGHGLGSAVLQPVLATCDRDGVGAYLESSHERNIHFYARHGFQVTGELRLPRGPRMWTMWREPT
jgi:ribosomal protein S18 acetylase RimI-like enzyme